MDAAEALRSADHGKADQEHVLLRRLGLYKRLDTATRQALTAALSRRKPVRTGEVLSSDCSQEVWFLASGMAGHLKAIDSKRCSITALVLPGDVCDFGFLTNTEQHVDVITLANCEIIALQTRQVIDLCEAYPSVMGALLQAASVRQAIAAEHLLSLGQRSAVERIAHLLCEVHWRLDEVGLVDRFNYSFEFRARQVDIGQMLGVSTVHVNRSLQALRMQKLISMRNGRVFIHDLEGLRQQAEFNPAYLRQDTCS